MIPSAENMDHLTDEEYLIHRAKEDQNRDPFSSKCWLITAQALFPKNFGIQFEVFQIEKTAKNVKEAAKCFGTLLLEFPLEPQLCHEVDNMMSALRQTSSESQLSFAAQLFHTLPKDVQRTMVHSAAERSQDAMTHCRLMLLLTTMFPETTAQHGLKLVETLLTAENTCLGPINPFRMMLVCELVPRILQTRGLEVRPKILHNLLSRSIEFYVAYVTTPVKSIGDTESKIEDPWQRLFSVVQMIGWNLGWELADGFDNICNRELILQSIETFVEGGARLGGPKGDGGEDVREVLFTTLTIFLHSITDYVKRLYPDFNQGESSISSSSPMTLLEAFISSEQSGEDSPTIVPPTPKRLRPSLDDDVSLPIITVSRSTPGAVGTPVMVVPPGDIPGISTSALSQALITSIKSWGLLNSFEQLRSEFLRLLETLGTERWWWLHSVFNVDILIYEGRRMEAARELRHSLSLPQNISVQAPHSLITMNLKLASVLYSLNNLSSAAESVLEVIPLLPSCPEGSLTSDLTIPTQSGRRHLHFLAITRSQALQYITALLIHALRQRIIVDRPVDECIGHLITLVQYDWPRYENVFEEMVELIRKQGGFSYPLFYKYVITPDILEEFMYLATKDGGNLNLDIIPLNHTNKQQRTISTRGVDRDLKHDFKMGMKRLMLRSNEPIDVNIIAFLTREGVAIHQNLM